MKIVPFEMERWQSTWENSVDYNLSESGVQPIPLRELLRDEPATERFLDHPLAYSQGNGTQELRSKIADLYRGATPNHVLVTTGSSEANLLAMWHLVEPGDEIVVMLPNYMENWGLVQAFGGTVKPLRLREDRKWQFDPEELSSLVTRK
ncbi:MAG TPA: aminotransferase class I/II-fold pyridoxal phosphate-dependent enzyme, partial [Thermoplasmata archaeon]|nr:aminotransferase class I/II-fold pyridoxal phosphate-dependent enzyme [Thermoplasmata archaeon]